MASLDLNKINSTIADRSNVFYWQTDRVIEPDEVRQIWADRHRYFTDEELIRRVNEVLTDDKLASVTPLDLNAQTNLGSVSSVRVGRLESGEEVILRCFPKGVLNGYFHVEAAAAEKTRLSGLPTYRTLAIHNFSGGNDFAFHVLEKLPGMALKIWLDTHPEDEAHLINEVGSMMANLHKIEVKGFGPFDNQTAETGQLLGLHSTLGQAIRAGLEFNLDVLKEKDLLSPDQEAAITKLFDDSNPLLKPGTSVLVHNDFADWNLLTDGKGITGILDFDECVGGDPIEDIACWSTFFDPDRLDEFLNGYWQVATKPADFEAKFELFRLRYVISKMTLRLKRSEWDSSDFLKERINNGTKHLAQSLKYFGL